MSSKVSKVRNPDFEIDTNKEGTGRLYLGFQQRLLWRRDCKPSRSEQGFWFVPHTPPPARSPKQFPRGQCIALEPTAPAPRTECCAREPGPRVMWPSGHRAISCAARSSTAWAAVCFLRDTAGEPRGRAVRRDPGATVPSARRGGRGALACWTERRAERPANSWPGAPCPPPKGGRARGTQPALPRDVAGGGAAAECASWRAPRGGSPRPTESGPGNFSAVFVSSAADSNSSQSAAHRGWARQGLRKWARRGRFGDGVCDLVEPAGRVACAVPKLPASLPGVKAVTADLCHGDNRRRPLVPFCWGSLRARCVSRLFVYGLCLNSSSQLIIFKTEVTEDSVLTA